jgi:hypothetical protein
MRRRLPTTSRCSIWQQPSSAGGKSVLFTDKSLVAGASRWCRAVTRQSALMRSRIPTSPIIPPPSDDRTVLARDFMWAMGAASIRPPLIVAMPYHETRFPSSRMLDASSELDSPSIAPLTSSASWLDCLAQNSSYLDVIRPCPQVACCFQSQVRTVSLPGRDHGQMRRLDFVSDQTRCAGVVEPTAGSACPALRARWGGSEAESTSSAWSELGGQGD